MKGKRRRALLSIMTKTNESSLIFLHEIRASNYVATLQSETQNAAGDDFDSRHRVYNFQEMDDVGSGVVNDL